MLTLALSASAGLLLAASLPAVGFWPLAWGALVPLFLVTRGCRPQMAFAYGWWAGFVFYLVALSWITPTITNYTSIGTALALALLLLMAATAALGMGVFAALVEWLAAAGISRVVAAPLAWVVVEWTRTFFPLPFPWLLLGYSQYSVIPVVQVVDVAGVYGLSALIVFTNAAATEFVRDGLAVHRRLLAALAALVVVVLAYGQLRLAVIEGQDYWGSLRVGLIQGNVAQSQKWDESRQDTILASYLQASAQVVGQGAKLVVWPESAVPFYLSVDDRARTITGFADDNNTHLLVGAPGYERRGDGPALSYNQAWQVVPGRGLDGPYDKIRLVPFGEYVPFGGLFGIAEKAVEGLGEFGRGRDYTVFEGPVAGQGEGGVARRARFSALVCYEGIFPDFVGRFVRNGADFLVNISNDAWYGRTAAPHQHLAMVAVRAVEQRVPVLRATNTGVSAVIDQSGRIHGSTELFSQAVVVDTIKLGDLRSLYSRVGDLFVYLALVALVALVYLRLRLGSVRLDGQEGAGR